MKAFPRLSSLLSRQPPAISALKQKCWGHREAANYPVQLKVADLGSIAPQLAPDLAHLPIIVLSLGSTSRSFKIFYLRPWLFFFFQGTAVLEQKHTSWIWMLRIPCSLDSNFLFPLRSCKLPISHALCPQSPEASVAFHNQAPAIPLAQGFPGQSSHPVYHVGSFQYTFSSRKAYVLTLLSSHS